MTEGNEQRMERLFHDHYEQMYRFAFALLHDNEEAMDVLAIRSMLQFNRYFSSVSLPFPSFSLILQQKLYNRYM